MCSRMRYLRLQFSGGGSDIHDYGPFQVVRQSSLALAPTQRAFAAGDSPAAVNCVVQCAKKMKEDMQREAPGFDPNKPVAGEFDAQKLEKLCQIHDSSKSCLDRCPGSASKMVMQKAMEITQYMCHDSTYKQNAPCLYQVQKNMTGICEGASKCGQYKQKVEHYQQNRPTSEEQLKDLMKNTCLLMKCTLECFKQTVAQKCGQAALHDLQGLLVKTIQFLKYTVESMGLGQVYPQECESVTV